MFYENTGISLKPSVSVSDDGTVQIVPELLDIGGHVRYCLGHAG
jgi:hypothetical protein